MYIQPEVIVPVIRKNGSPAEDLIHSLDDAILTSQDAYAAIRRTKPHPADYPIEAIGLRERAKIQHNNRLNALLSVIDSLQREQKSIMDQAARLKESTSAGAG